MSKNKRLTHCGRYPSGSYDGGVAAKVRSDGTAYLDGLQTCGSVWACPVCSAVIRTRRALEVETAVRFWLAAGGGVEFVTLTIRHGVGDALRDSFDACAFGWQRGVIAGRPWVDDRASFGIRGFCRTIETTYGQANGWHPHVHALLFTTKPLTDAERSTLGARIFGRWERAAGRGALNRECFRIQPVTSGDGSDLARYLTKVQDDHGGTRSVGLEMTRHDLKKRRGRLMPFDLCEGAAAGEKQALTLWWEWEQVTKGRRCLTWSKGMRDLVGLGAEQTDEELAQEDQGGEVVAVLTAKQWRAVRNAEDGPATLLDLAEAGGEAIGEWLRWVYRAGG